MKCYMHLPNNEFNQEIESSGAGSCIDYDIALKHHDFVLITAYPFTDTEYRVVCDAIQGHFHKNGRSLKRKKFNMGLPNDGVVG